jgi:hypothetical protein
MTKIENIETELKETTTKLNKKETEDSKDKEGAEALKKKIGELKDKTKTALNEFKIQTGTELYNRFMKGFVKSRENTEENERISNNEFLFNKLKF